MNSPIIESHLEKWTKALRGDAAIISVYSHIRDIPYAIIPELLGPLKSPELILAIGSGSCTPNQAIDLVYRLAAAFGIVKCGPAFIYDEYRGKGSRRESLKVVFRNQEMERDFERELELCRRLNRLGIER